MKHAKSVKNVRALRIGYCLEDPDTTDQAIDEICLSLELAEGRVKQAAELLAVNRNQVTRWVEKCPKLRERLNQIRVRFGHKWAKED